MVIKGKSYVKNPQKYSFLMMREIFWTNVVTKVLQKQLIGYNCPLNHTVKVTKL
jgi:hypothetical protein